MHTLLQMPAYSRRKAFRFEAQTEPVWVYCSCASYKDVLRVRNLSLGGIFVETGRTQPVGTKTEIDFLVEDGQIRTKAIVCHVDRGSGMGLEFLGIVPEDGPHLAALLTRIHDSFPPRLSLHD